MNSRGLGQLTWEKRISILAASQADQEAIENDELKHGYLTFALAEKELQWTVRRWHDQRDGMVGVSPLANRKECIIRGASPGQ
jgi:hypothetical protein